MNFTNGKGTVPHTIAELAVFEATKQQTVSKHDFETYWKPLITVQRKYINGPIKKK